MKRITKPTDSGSNDLSAATRDKGLKKTFPDLLKFGLRAERLAQHYDVARGDPNNVRSTRISAKEQEAILYLYGSPPKGMAYIKELRSSLAGETCPMCGGHNPTELDHYLTQKKYPEYSWLSFNLIPACSCNRQRGERLFDPATHARILHPYYDDCMSSPLVILSFDPDTASPEFLIKYLIDPADPNYANVEFHIDHIVRRTNFLAFISKRWQKLKVRPDNVLPHHNDYRTNPDEFHKYLLGLSVAKSAGDGANAWEAIFLRSISSRNIADWLFLNP